MKYFFDNCISHRLVEILAIASDAPEKFVHIKDVPEVGGRNAKDVEWIPYVAQMDWIAVTLDRHMKTRAHEVAALRATGLR